MRKNKRKGLQRLLAMAFTFVMVMVFAGFIGKTEVRADGSYKVKVTVTDKKTGAVISGAKAIFTTYDRIDGDYPEVEATLNDDGTYSVNPSSCAATSYSDWCRVYATAKGYKDSRTYNKYSGFWVGQKLTLDENAIQEVAFALERDPAVDKLETAFTQAQNDINNYVNNDDYDDEQKQTIIDIKNEYTGENGKLFTEVSKDDVTEDNVDDKITKLNELVVAARAEMDAVATSQDNTNEEYADYISFVSDKGMKKDLSRKVGENGAFEYGKFVITLSRYEKGTFKISGNDADTKVSWYAIKKMLANASAGSYDADYEIIDNKYDIGRFLSDKAIQNVANPDAVLGTIENCSVKFKKGGKDITVTFDLTITNEDTDTIDAKAVEAMIKALGDEITLKQQAAVAEAKAAYDDLSDGAKDKVSKESLDALNAAINTIEKLENEATIEDLRTQLETLNEQLAAALLAKKNAEDNVKDLQSKLATEQTKVTAAVAAQEDAETKADKAKAAQKDAETKADKAKAAQKDAETKAANAVAAQKAAETKAANAEKAQKAAEQKAADAEKKMNAAIKSTLPKLNLKVTAGKKKATLSWNKSSKGNGYIIYRSTSKNGVYQKVKTITNLKTTKFTDKNLKSKQRYYYKICVYQGNVNGTLSTAKNVKVK